MYFKNYNIHNLLKLQIVTGNFNLFKGLNFPLSYFEVKECLNKPDILLNIGKFSPSNSDCFLVDHKYYIKENYIYFKEYSDKVVWEAEIFGIENPPIIINFNLKLRGIYRYIAPDLVAQDLILLPLIELFLGKNHYFFAHGGGIVKNNNTFLFLGRPGSLKTSIIMDFLKMNSKLLGDDRLIFDMESKRVYQFQLYAQALEYMIKHFKNEHLSFFQRLVIKSRFLSEYSNFSDIWETGPVEIKALYLLKLKETKYDKVDINPIDVNIAIQKIIANNKAEIYGSSIPPIAKRRNFPDYLTAYSYVYPNSSIARYWDNLKLDLKEMLNNTLIYEVEIPSKFSSQLHDQFGNNFDYLV